MNASNSRRSFSTLRQLGEVHQIGLAGDHVFHAPGLRAGRSTTCCATRIASSISWLRCSPVSFSCATQVLAHLRSAPAAKLLVEDNSPRGAARRRCSSARAARCGSAPRGRSRPGSRARGCRRAAGTRSGSATAVTCRGSVTTPASCVTLDSSCDATATSAFGSSLLMHRPDAGCRSSRLRSSLERLRVAAAYRRRTGSPCRSGTRPAEVCGELTNPSSSRSAMTLRMVAELSSVPESRDSVREPTG